MDPNAVRDGAYKGRLSQTTRGSVLVTSDDGRAFPASVYRAINIHETPDLESKLLSGELNEVECPYTGATYRLAAPVVYHDPVRQVFALLLPQELRHQELRCRRELLEELEEHAETLPVYVRNFQVVFDPRTLAHLESARAEEPADEPAAALETSKELARQRQQLEEEREQLRVEQNQLQEIRERFDRERQQMDEVERRLAQEREELEALRAQLEQERNAIEAQKLNLEQETIRKAQGAPKAANEEATQVVTDDQFIEIVDETQASPELLAEASEFSEVLESVEEVVITPLTGGIPTKLMEVVGDGRQRALEIHEEVVLAVAQMPKDKIEALFDSRLSFYVQLHDVADYPLVTLLLARLDDNDQVVESVGWAVDVSDEGHRRVVEHLLADFRLRVGLYSTDGTLLRGVEVQAPLEANLAWIRQRAQRLLEESAGAGSFNKASAQFQSKDYERLGTMRHNFTRDSFEDATTPSEVKLATGIVGFWSSGEKFEYLIANRSFPLDHFREIQQRVVQRAANFGIFLPRPLRGVALELGLASDEAELAELLLANFAEVCIAIRKNDLQPADQWENWDFLLGLGEEVGVPPDPDVVELAEVSLKRAQEQQELAERSENEGTNRSDDTRVEPMDFDGSLVVARRSESTGVTYFLPNDALIDSFDDLASMGREDLELLLADAGGRLEAAQMLIERFGASTTGAVMEAADTMTAAEVAALAKFLESKADGLEGELVRSVEIGGPSATYIAARALSKIKSTSAIPVLLDAIQDPKKYGDRERLAAAMSAYGEKLLPGLKRAIKREGANDSLVVLLSHLDERVEGTLSELFKDHSKNLREAARLARERRESKSA